MSNLQSLEQRMEKVDYQVISDDKDKQISDLEAKLAESEKRLVNCVDFDTWQKTAKENNELKQQLVEVKNSCDYYMNRANDLLINNQDKISFAVEQLEQLKYNIGLDNSDEETGDMPYVVDTTCLFELIDNQIKQLKEGK